MPRKKRSEEQYINPKSGVFTDLEPGDYDDEEDEELDNDLQFLDYREINGMGEGKSFVKSKRAKKQRGWLVNPLVTSRPTGKDKVQACAPFHFTDPWWKITILRTSPGRNHTVYLKDMFALSYELRQDVNCSKQKVVSMFLTRRSEDGDNVNDCLTAFESYLRQTGQTNSLTFNNIEDILRRFEESLPEAEKFKALRLQNRFYTRAGRHIYLAKTYPRIFEFIPQLLPNQFLTILDVDEEIIEELDNDLVERPWIFGFKQALYADRDLIGCEAPWIALIQAGFRDKIKNPYKDALIIYEYLKEDSRGNGHTCKQLDALRKVMSQQVHDFTKALNWLKRKRVVKETQVFGKTCIFLYGLYKCEENITRGIMSLFLQPRGEELELKVDLQSEAFASIRTDREQLRAAEIIKVSPVVVISGKGGCGKTTVVTKVLSNCNLPKLNTEDTKSDTTENAEGDKSEQKPTSTRSYENGDMVTENPGDMVTENPVDTEGQSDDKTSEDKKLNIRSHNQEHILYTAPTGKAANLLGRRANTTGYTLHQVIWSYRRFVSESKKNPEENMTWRFCSKSILVVDECSLVSVKTFSTLLKILMENARLTRIILLGDIRQLPSIEPGNFLSDVFTSLITRGCAIELKTNHRAESQLIVDNATRISLRKYPIMDPERNFKFHRVPEDVQDKNDFTDSVIHRMLRSEPVLKSDKTSQFVAFTRKDCLWINSVACKYYNNHTLTDEKNRLMFQPGDKVCMTKNGTVGMYEKQPSGQFQRIKEENTQSEEDGEQLEVTLMSATQCPTQVPHVKGDNKAALSRNEQGTSSNGSKADNTKDAATQEEEEEKYKAIRLCNGEIFFIIDDYEVCDPKKIRYLQLTDYDKDDPKTIWVDFHELMKECVMKHAWARTIHTYQGSESEAVIYVVGNTLCQNWQHVYTAVTRGRKAVHIVGTERNLIRAVTKKEDKRNTGLKYLLVNTLPKKDKLNQTICAADAANLTLSLDRSQMNTAPGPSHQFAAIEMHDSEEYTTSFVHSENSQNLQPLPSSTNIQHPQLLSLNSNNNNVQDSEDSNDSSKSELLLQTGTYSSNIVIHSEDSNDSNQSELLLQTGTYSSNIAVHSEDSNDSNQSELLLQTGTYSSNIAVHSEDSNDSNQSELLLQTGNYQSLIEDDSDEEMPSFVYEDEIEGPDNINFTKLRGRKQKPSSSSEVDQHHRRTARNVFRGIMFPDNGNPDLKSTRTSSSGSLTSSTPLATRTKTSGLNNQRENSPDIVCLDSPTDSPFTRLNNFRIKLTPGSKSLGHDSQWSEVDEDLLMNLEDIDEEETSSQGWNPHNNPSSPPFSTNNTFDNSDFNDELSAACYLLEQSQRRKDSENANNQTGNTSFTQLNGHSDRTNIHDGTQDLSMLLSPTKRRSTTSLDSPITPKKLKHTIPDSNLLVSPARRLLTQLSIDLDGD